tara:strand:- start:483 stop:842 length:360 start_codon:yes stop_codon:yes gene_type:complete
MNLILNKPKYCNNDDRICVQLLLNELLVNDRSISVHDGEELVLESTRDLALILEELSQTGEDIIIAHDAGGRELGSFHLIWCNGSEDDPIICISCHTANTFCDLVFNTIEVLLLDESNN